MGINIFVIIRVFIGGLFAFSGFEKLIGPYQNFLYVIQSYELFPMFLENAAAYVMPWIEFLLGVFLVFGLSMRLVLRALSILILMFICVVAQAIVRGLPITECGCFGELMSLPLQGILIFDGVLLLLTGILIGKEDSASVFSLDRYFSNRDDKIQS